MLTRASSRALAMTAVTAVVLSGWWACSGDTGKPMAPRTSPLAAVPAEAWQRLARSRVLFGHQSVGFNILEGVRDVMKIHPEIALRIVDVPSSAEDTGPALAHFAAGQNGRPISKVDDFAARIASSLVKPDVALLKLCYIDVDARSDVRAIFDHYRARVTEMRAAAPATTIVHLTMPLRVVQSDWKVPVKRLIGRPIGGYADNIKRNGYNDLVRAAYRGREPLFDVAEVESTRPDGGRVTFESGGQTYFALAPEYTTDGGHLNVVGRRVVAEALLSQLAREAVGAGERQHR